MRQLSPTTTGILCILFGIGIFSVQDLILKLLSGDYPLHQAMVLRSLTALPCLLILVWWKDGSLRGIFCPGWWKLLGRGTLNFFSYASYYLGLASLPWTERSWARGIFEKIPRLLTQKLLGTVEKIIDDNQALLALFQQMLPKVSVSAAPARTSPLPWFRNVYDGRLVDAELAELGLLPSA